MDFPEFARKTRLILEPGSNTSQFTKTLFEWVLPDDKLSLIGGYSDNTFKAYYNGNSQITKIAKIVLPHIEDGIYFEDNLADIEDTAANALCNDFREAIPDCNAFNIAEKLGQLFALIIKEAAASTRNTTATETANNCVEAEVLDEDSNQRHDSTGTTIIQNQVNIENNTTNTFNIENSTVTFNL